MDVLEEEEMSGDRVLELLGIYQEEENEKVTTDTNSRMYLNLYLCFGYRYISY